MINHFLVCTSSCFALFIIYARVLDGRPPQYRSIPTTAERSSSEVASLSPCDGGVSHCQPRRHDRLEKQQNRSPSPGRPHLTGISDLRSALARLQLLSGCRQALSQSREHFSGTKLVLCLIIHLLFSLVLSGRKAGGNLFLMWNFMADFRDVLCLWQPCPLVSHILLEVAP